MWYRGRQEVGEADIYKMTVHAVIERLISSSDLTKQRRHDATKLHT